MGLAVWEPWHFVLAAHAEVGFANIAARPATAVVCEFIVRVQAAVVLANQYRLALAGFNEWFGLGYERFGQQLLNWGVDWAAALGIHARDASRMS